MSISKPNNIVQNKYIQIWRPQFCDPKFTSFLFEIHNFNFHLKAPKVLSLISPYFKEYIKLSLPLSPYIDEAKNMKKKKTNFFLKS